MVCFLYKVSLHVVEGTQSKRSNIAMIIVKGFVVSCARRRPDNRLLIYSETCL